MSKKREYLWMKVTQDKYELPIVIADSVMELSRLTGVPVDTIYKNVYNGERNHTRSRFVRVKIDE